MKGRVKRILSLVLMISIIFCTTPYQTYATQSTKDKLKEAQEEQRRKQEQVNEQQEEVDDLTGKKNSLKKELNSLNDELEQIVGRINDLEEKIANKEAEITETLAALEEARTVEANQYEAMKKRVRFMYEDSKNLYLDILFNSKTFSNFITLSNYIDDLSRYDKKKLEEYKEIRHNVELLEEKLEGEKAELDVLKADAEAEKANVMTVIEKTQGKVQEYSELIDEAEAELLAYEKELEASKNSVAALQKQLEEELRMTQLANSSYWRDISEVSFDEGDRYLLAVLIYCEAGGEPYEGQVAVGSVVINRVLSSVYPDTVTGVIYQKSQFSPVGSGRLAYYLSIGKTTQSCYNAADAAMSGVTNVGNCLHFRTPIPGLTGIQIGGHIFY